MCASGWCACEINGRESELDFVGRRHVKVEMKVAVR